MAGARAPRATGTLTNTGLLRGFEDVRRFFIDLPWGAAGASALAVGAPTEMIGGSNRIAVAVGAGIAAVILAAGVITNVVYERRRQHHDG